MAVKDAESFAERRARNVLLVAIAAIGFSVFAVTRPASDHSTRSYFIMAVFLGACLVWTFGTPRFLRWSRDQRSLLNDERVRLNKQRAAQAGYVIALAGLGVTAFPPVALDAPSSTIALIFLAAAIIGAALTFAGFEYAGK